MALFLLFSANKRSITNKEVIVVKPIFLYILVALSCLACGPSALELRVASIETRISRAEPQIDQLNRRTLADERFLFDCFQKIEQLRQRQLADEKMLVQLQELEGKLMDLRARNKRDREDTETKLNELGLRIVELQGLNKPKGKKR